MKTLERQLQDYGEYQIELRDAITPDSVTSRPVQPDSSVWWRNRSAAGLAAAAAVLLLVGVVPLLLAIDGQDAVRTPSTPTSADPDARGPVIVEIDPSERPRLESQWEFVSFFMRPGSGGCTGTGITGEPLVCTIAFDPPVVAETETIEIVVADVQETPGETPAPDDRPLLTVAMDQARELIGPRLAEAYEWGLEHQPEHTEAACGVGFETNDQAIAWDPGFRADIPCGEYLAGVLVQTLEAPSAVDPLTFTEIAQPGSDVFPTPWTTASFSDALYAMTRSGQLWALADGENWEFVKNLSELSGPPVSSIDASDDMLVLFARDQGVNRGGEECMVEGQQIYVHVMRIDGSWTNAEIPQPFTGESECRTLELDDMVVGPLGIMLTGEVDGPGTSAFEGHSVGWWSQDGVTWQPLDTTLPNEHGGIQDAAATADGFVVVTDGDDDTPRVTLTTKDGQSWQTVESAARHNESLIQLNGEVLVSDPATNLARELFSGEARLSAEIFRGRRAWGPHVHFGGLGIVGTPSCSSLPLGCANPSSDGGDVETFVYSPDGVSFVEWKPTEFDYYTVGVGGGMSEESNGTLGLVRVLAMTDDFVLLVHEREDNAEIVQTLWVGRPSDQG